MKALIGFEEAAYFLSVSKAIQALPKNKVGDLDIKSGNMTVNIPKEMLDTFLKVEKIVIKEMNKSLKS